MAVQPERKTQNAVIGDRQRPGKQVDKERCDNTGHQKPAHHQRHRTAQLFGNTNGNGRGHRLRRQGRQHQRCRPESPGDHDRIYGRQGGRYWQGAQNRTPQRPHVVHLLVQRYTERDGGWPEQQHQPLGSLLIPGVIQ